MTEEGGYSDEGVVINSRQLSNVTSIRLCSNRIGEEGIMAISECKNVESLHLNSNAEIYKGAWLFCRTYGSF